jgi:DNA-binding CsgD family transcriptional regulator
MRIMNQKEFDAIYPTRLTPKQHQVLKLFLEGESEEAIAKSIKISDSSGVRYHISNICELFGFKNEPGQRFRQRDELIPLFAKYKPELVNPELIKNESNISKVLEVPKRSITFNSPFYIERHPIESECCDKILKPGAVICIEAPKYTGKTLLLKRILAHARSHNYLTVSLDFETESNTVFSNYEIFLKWLCRRVGKSLGLKNKLAEFWDSDFCDEHWNTTTYFEDYLLKEQTEPLVLAFENFDRVFEQKSFQDNFCRLLRGWSQRHVEGDQFADLWKKLRLIILQSSNVYSPLNINFSPLHGVCSTVKLLDFTQEEVTDFANCYQQKWVYSSSHIQDFMAMFGGHPYLVKEALVCLENEKFTLEKLCKIATEISPFKDHLQEHLQVLLQPQHRELAIAYHKVITESQSIQLETNLIFKLESMGLVLVDKNNCVHRCGLYKQYFSTRLNLIK